MASKLDKIERLTEGLRGLPEPPAQPAKPKRERGVAVNVRMPEALLARYAAEAGRRSAERGRTVTAQTVMLEVLAAGLPEHG
jgi:hypothetical protein